MRILTLFVAVIVIGFASVNLYQGAAWPAPALQVIAGIVAAISAAKPHWLAEGIGIAIFCVLWIGALVGIVMFWPADSDFWQQSMWWTTPAARDALGMVLAFSAITCAGLTARRKTITPGPDAP